MNCGKETTETLMTTDCTEKKFLKYFSDFSGISASVVKFVTSNPQNPLSLARMSAGVACALGSEGELVWGEIPCSSIAEQRKGGTRAQQRRRLGIK